MQILYFNLAKHLEIIKLNFKLNLVHQMSNNLLHNLKIDMKEKIKNFYYQMQKFIFVLLIQKIIQQMKINYKLLQNN